MLRLSVTQIGSYMTYLAGRISLNQLVDGLTQIVEPTIKMKAGSVFHCKLQGLPYEDDIRLQIDDDDMALAISKVDTRSQLYEYKIRKTMQTTRGKVIVTGVADQIVGNVVHEFKTTYSPFNYDRYADSIQWMGYCHLFNVEQVVYQVWQLTEPDEDCPIEKIKPLKVKGYHEFSMYANRCTEQKFLDALNGLADLIHILDLQDAIQRKAMLREQRIAAII
jgi:hypothetical protein